MLDKEGYYTHIGGSHLKITSLQGEQIGHIDHTHKTDGTRNQHGLYKQILPILHLSIFVSTSQ